MFLYLMFFVLFFNPFFGYCPIISTASTIFLVNTLEFHHASFHSIKYCNVLFCPLNNLDIKRHSTSHTYKSETWVTHLIYDTGPFVYFTLRIRGDYKSTFLFHCLDFLFYSIFIMTL